MGDNKDNLCTLLLYIEVRKLIPDVHLKLSEEQVYTKINLNYYESTGIRFEKIGEDEKKILYVWLKENQRYNLLNVLIRSIIDKLVVKGYNNITEIDSFMCNNLSSIISVSTEQLKNIFSVNMFNRNDLIFSNISKSKVDEYVIEFLKLVDPTMEWIGLYKNLKDENRIIYWDECTLKEKKEWELKLGEKLPDKINYCRILDDGSIYIFVTNNRTLYDFVILIHEFFHYLVYYKNNYLKVPNYLKEFFSMFYEKYSLLFLSNKGYSQEEIDSISNNRRLDTCGLIFSSSLYLSYLDIYLKNGEITEDLSIEYAKIANKVFDDNKDFKKFVLENHPDFFDYKRIVHEECDDCIKRIIKDSWEFYECLPYIIGDFLSEQGMVSLVTDEDILNKIKGYLEDVSFINPYEIFEGVGCDVKKLDFVKDYKDRNIQMKFKSKKN